MSGSTVIPCMRYRDALAAIDWLGRAFGLQRQAVYADGDVVHHAQLTLGSGMVMLGSASKGGDEERPYDKLMKMPLDVGGNTMSACLIVPDADAVCATAKAAGARIAMDIADQAYGGRAFTCIDPEGYVWSIGTYDPWVGPPPSPA